MTVQASTPTLYYRHSGQYSVAGAVAALLGGSLAAIVLGAAYAYVDLYIPIGGWVTFLITGGTGFALGAIIGQLLKKGKVRNVRVGMLIAAAAAVVLFFAAWIFWIYALLQRGKVQVTVADLLTHPGATWRVVLKINEVGAWSFKDLTPTGIVLWLFWAAEAALLVGVPVWFARAAINGAPFCEACGKWGKTRELLHMKCAELEHSHFKCSAR